MTNDPTRVLMRNALEFVILTHYYPGIFVC
jgi:hypothetical protein